MLTMLSRFRILPLSLLAAGTSATLLLAATSLSAKEIKLPAETARYAESSLPGYAMTTAMCSTCHSADYTRMQPNMPRAFWKAAVTKMQKTFGAPIPDEAVEPIADYLVKTYGAERAAAAPKAEAAPAKPAR